MAGATCPKCGAGVRPGSDWCTLCFADLRPVPPPRVSPAIAMPTLVAPALGGPGLQPTQPAGTDAPAAGATMTAPARAQPRRDAELPCPVCATPVLLSAGICTACGAGYFDQLKTDAPTVRLPLVGDVMAMSKGARAGVAFGVALVVVAVLFVLIELISAL